MAKNNNENTSWGREIGKAILLVLKIIGKIVTYILNIIICYKDIELLFSCCK